MREGVTWRGRIIALLVGLGLLLGLSEAILRVVFPHWKEFYSGWFMKTIRVPNRSAVIIGTRGFSGYFAQNNGDFRIKITINDFGLRDPESVEAANGRVWMVGDSMTFGWGVEQNEMYSAQIAQVSGIPTYNVASPGTDICGYQTLADRMPHPLRPRAVIVGLVLENDIRDYACAKEAEAYNRNPPPLDREEISLDLGGIKRFLTGRSALYNFFAVSVKRLSLMEKMLVSLGLIAKEHGYQLTFDVANLDHNVAASADELARMREMFPAETPFAVLIVPGRFEIRDGDPLYHRMRIAVAAALTKRQIPFIDPFDAFKATGFIATHFLHDGHWSARGHAIAARAITDWLEAQGLTAAPAAAKGG